MKDSVRAYLTEIGRYPLLKSREQEAALSKTYREYQKLLDESAPEIKSALLVEEKRIFKIERMSYGYWEKTAPIVFEEQVMQIIFDGIKAKHCLYCANLRLVVSVAKRYVRHGLPLLDAIQFGNIGLLKAIEKFDPAMGFKLSTYAFWWIRQQITRAIGEISREIRLPIHVYEKLNKIKTAYKQMGIKLNRQPKIAEIAEYLRLDEKKLRELLMHFVPAVALDYKPDNGQGEDNSIMDIFDYPSDEAGRIELEFLKNDLAPVLQRLSASELEVIIHRFGLDGNEPKTFKEIGNATGNRSRERIRQIEMKALNKLKHNARHLKDYL